jgi:lipoic acid synthetase
MILGATCTRNCRFCAVASAASGDPVRADEPRELSHAIAELSLSYAVLTSVDRDDLSDRGAGHFARCIRAIKALSPNVLVEVLIPDYDETEMAIVLAANPDTVAHNVETVPRLQNVRDARASYQVSLRTLGLAAHPESGGAPLVKSSILLGLGETETEVSATLDDLLDAGCRSVVLGQYLQPTKQQIPVVEYVHPDRFAAYADLARSKGFTSVVSAPLARTSYHAHEAFPR